MTGHQCLRCHSALRQVNHIRKSLTTCRTQTYSSTKPSKHESSKPSADESTNPPGPTPPSKPQLLDIDALLSKPTWSVRSLLPSSSTTTSTSSSDSNHDTHSPTPTISPTQLHHLLRLSALPQPRSPIEEATMLSTLSTQLHFVRAIRAVDTTGVEPLVTIRDETEEALRENIVGLQNERIKEALAAERKVGRMGRVKRVRRKEGAGMGRGEDGSFVEGDRRSEEERWWDPLEGAKGRTVGRLFVVESGKGSRSGEKTEVGD